MNAAQTMTFFEGWKTPFKRPDDGTVNFPEHGAAGDLAGILEWIGEGWYPTSVYQVTVSRGPDGAFTRETESIEFPYHRDGWDDDDLYLSAVATIETMGEDVEAWQVKMDELRDHFSGARA